MMIIFLLVKIITTLTHTKKNDMPTIKNDYNFLTQYVLYIPYVHTIMYYNNVYIIYHS